jgi:FtsP/CotA-like multicopper oxidase with cupredoxin domain
MRGLAAVLLGLVLAPAAGAAERTFTLVTVEGRAPPAQQVLRVTQGDVVTINLTSNRTGEVHLHGYQKVAKLAPGKGATWKFTAHATGRYRLEWHGMGDSLSDHRDPALSTLEVLPK